MADNPTHAEKLTLREAWNEVSWFSTTFSSIVGGPSVLALLQMIFVEHRLVDALQWIVDGYDDIVSVLGSYVEPYLAPAVAWLNEVFNWRLELHPHWKPLFLLAMIWVTVSARLNLRGSIRWFDTLIGLPLLALATLAGAAAAGTMPLDSAWWAQGIMAGAPVAAVYFAMSLLGAANELVERGKVSRGFSDAMFVAVLLSGLAFAAGVGVSFLPFIASGAGILAVGGLVLFVGGLFFSLGLSHGRMYGVRAGLTIMGGFATAAMILIADAIIKALTA